MLVYRYNHVGCDADGPVVHGIALGVQTSRKRVSDVLDTPVRKSFHWLGEPSALVDADQHVGEEVVVHRSYPVGVVEKLVPSPGTLLRLPSEAVGAQDKETVPSHPHDSEPKGFSALSVCIINACCETPRAELRAFTYEIQPCDCGAVADAISINN